MQNPVDLTIFDIIDVTPADPAAGTNVTFVVPIVARIQIIGVTFNLVTDANVASRFPIVFATPIARTFGLTGPTSPQTATQNVTHHFSLTGSQSLLFAAQNLATVPLSASLILRTGDILNISIAGLQAGDQISSVLIRYKQWIMR